MGRSGDETPFEHALRKMRAICLPLPQVSETSSWGHPNFRAGKTIFASLEEYRGRPCICFKATLMDQEMLIADDRFSRAPYLGHRGWVSMTIERRMDWVLVEDLVLESYRLVARKRMIEALDGRDRET